MDHPSREQWARALVGAVIAGRYRLDSVLGMGGMGAVFAAVHLAIGRRVAVKLMVPEAAQTPEALERFQQEARAAATVERRGVVEVLDFGVDPARGAFLVMEHLRGEALSQKLKREGALDAREAARIIAPVLETLGVVHARGIVHRDLKPANLFLAQTEEGEQIVKVLDFGISRVAQPAGRAALTMPGTVLGTPRYMAPEQAIGMPDVDARADVYSVGAVLYTTLGGRKPYAECSADAVIPTMCERGPRPLREVRSGLRESLYMVVERAMARDRRERFQSAGEMLEALREAMPDADASWPATRPSHSPGARVGTPRVQPTPPPAGPPSLAGVPRAPWLDGTLAPAPSIPPAHPPGYIHVRGPEIGTLYSGYAPPPAMHPPARWPWVLLAIVVVALGAVGTAVALHSVQGTKAGVLSSSSAGGPGSVQSTGASPSRWAVVDADPTLRAFHTRLTSAQALVARGDVANARAMLSAIRDEMTVAAIPRGVGYARVLGQTLIELGNLRDRDMATLAQSGASGLFVRTMSLMSETARSYTDALMLGSTTAAGDVTQCAEVATARAYEHFANVLPFLQNRAGSGDPPASMFASTRATYLQIAEQNLASAVAQSGDLDAQCDAEARTSLVRVRALRTTP